MKIDTKTAQQFLNALSDRIGGGDMEIAAITPEEAGEMTLKEVDKFVIELMGYVVENSKGK